MTDTELHNEITPYLICKDYLVSDESYYVMKNHQLEMLVTSPIPSEFDKYYLSKKYQSHNSSNYSVLNLLYNLVKKRSFKQKTALFNKEIKNQKILDIGAGTGDFLLYCKNKGLNITGVEPNENARKKAESKGIILQDRLDKVVKKKFNIITLWHVLEHIPNLYESIEQIKSLLSEKGQLFIAVPNFKSYDAQYYKEFWAAYDVPRHLWHFSQQSIKTLFSSANMKVTRVYPLVYDSFYVSLLSEKNKTGKNNFIKAFLLGLKSNLKAMKSKEYSSLIYEIEHR